LLNYIGWGGVGGLDLRFMTFIHSRTMYVVLMMVIALKFKGRFQPYQILKIANNKLTGF